MKLLAVFLLVFSMMAKSSASSKDTSAHEEQVDLFQRSVPCTAGWTLINGRCFQYVKKGMTWAAAERNCLSMGANLASVQNANEYREMQKMIAASSLESKAAWIGGNSQEESIWLWSDGSRFDYKSWCSGEPNNDGGNQRCIQINYTAAKCWDDVNCAFQLHSVCAKKP
ncbi:ladderlectin-like [Xiphophorus hellerii]|uniref:ladderlectin-like n=1 Tax=Xiphophorus hellerii TaxID=8084 RepID=UPI0013B46CF3|nr:ladderlectin-like [Xiphophorus hellerii]